MWSDRRGTAKASSGPHRRWIVAALVLGGLVTDVSCGPQIPSGQPLTEGDLAVAPIDWNVAPLAAGKVVAIAENDDDVALFSDGSVSVWSGGESLGRDSSVRAWRSAAAVPALGFSGRWLLEVSDDGKAVSLAHGGSQTLSCEDVSARYLLSNSPVREVAALGGALVGFVTDGRLAISDGQRLKQYELSLHGLTGSLGKAAGITDDEVVVLFAQDDTLQRLSLPSVNWVALMALACCGPRAEADFIVSATTTSNRYFPLLTGSRSVVFRRDLLVCGCLCPMVLRWCATDNFCVRRCPPWAIPAMMRRRCCGFWAHRAEMPGCSPILRWCASGKRAVADKTWCCGASRCSRCLCGPVRGCHLPNGSAHLDLSTHSSWARYRRVLAQRVVAGTPTPMPPTGAGKLTADELAQVMAWTSRP